MTAAKKKDDGKLTLAWLANASAKMFRRGSDFRDYQSCRLTAIEDRLAQLDGRDDAKAARQAALAKANANRAAAGQESLVFRFVNSEATLMEWTDNLHDD